MRLLTCLGYKLCGKHQGQYNRVLFVRTAVRLFLKLLQLIILKLLNYSQLIGANSLHYSHCF